MTMTTPELGPRSPKFRPTPMERRLAHGVKFIVNQAYIHGGSSAKSGFEPGTFCPRRRGFVNSPHWSPKKGGLLHPKTTQTDSIETTGQNT
ncbi:hypothetical protein AVEN_233172-1 [Araneus ventricosus]|uniref:Uncharacterized protein n=1 Tax=Araneus ventricosus TaxID=182803 RepID=A0A4Y2EJ50_ARAVE|nr:hypothetical protein AVEN_233172-1 [Araneus ventricosus]